MPLTNLNTVTDLSTITPQDIDSIGENYGRLFVQSEVKMAQLRNFYSSIVSIRIKLKSAGTVTGQIERELILLKPKLAYSAGRQLRLKPFYELIKKGIDATSVNDEKKKVEAVDNLISITEAIVAYHRFYDPKSN